MEEGGQACGIKPATGTDIQQLDATSFMKSLSRCHSDNLQKLREKAQTWFRR